MIKINLVSETPTAATAKKRRRPEFSLGAKQGDIILLTILAIAVVVIGGLWFVKSNTVKGLRVQRVELQQERDRLQQFIDKVEELEAKRAELQNKIQVISDLKNNQKGPVRVLDEVSRALPELVWLTSMELNGSELSLNGVAFDETAVAAFITNLDASPFFQTEPSLGRIVRSNDTFQFTVQAVFTYAPPEIAAVQAGSET
ncbi:MAG: PilN domain-containing protein [Oceanicaulis sp.]|jgi:type IV pilus assembly protein PilN|nr:PilN domain-containing protein [Oceanicaulis sp.]